MTEGSGTPQFVIVNPHRSQAHSRLSLPYWGLRTGLRFAGPVFRGCGALRAVPQFSMVVPLRSQARLRHSLLHWAYYGLFRALRAASVRPSPLHPFGLRRLRPVSATGGGLRAPLSRLTLTAWCKTPQSAPLTAPLTQGSLLASGTADCLAYYARSASTSPFCKVICESKAISQPFCRNATGASPSAAS